MTDLVLHNGKLTMLEPRPRGATAVRIKHVPNHRNLMTSYFARR